MGRNAACRGATPLRPRDPARDEEVPWRAPLLQCAVAVAAPARRGAAPAPHEHRAQHSSTRPAAARAKPVEAAPVAPLYNRLQHVGVEAGEAGEASTAAQTAGQTSM